MIPTTTNQTAIITGCHGFLARHLIDRLKELDIQPIGVPRNILYAPYDSLRISLAKNEPDYIYALHAYGNMHNQQEEEKIVMANYFCTWNLLQASQYINYKSFVHISSSSVGLPVQTLYSATKAGAEMLCVAYRQQYKKPVVSIRPYSIYGPGEADFRFIPTVFRSCLTGSQMELSEGWHDWIYISDMVDCILSQTVECGTGVSVSNGDIVRIIEEITGKTANYIKVKSLRSFDTKEWVCKQPISGFVPVIVGLQRCYEYYKQRFKA